MKLSKLKYLSVVTAVMASMVFANMGCNNSGQKENYSTKPLDSTIKEGTQPGLDNTRIDTSSHLNPDTTKANPNNRDTSVSKKISATRKKGKISTSIAKVDRTVKLQTDPLGYYNYAETMPEYKGGRRSLEQYINNNIEYPADALDNNREGTVNVLFTIDENGNVGNVKTSGVKMGYGMDEAAVKVVAGMPKWTPGRIKGKNVKAWYTLPVTYKMD
jgi:TonB family protein